MKFKFKNVFLVLVAFLGIGFMILFFWENNSSRENENQEAAQNHQKKDIFKEISLPEPSGKTESVLESAIAGMESEIEGENEEDALAQEILNDENEVSAFSSAYEEVNF